MPIYICQEKQHNKSWEYTINGLTVTYEYGRVGSTLVKKVKTYSSTFARDKEIAAKIRNKTSAKKGYVLADEKKIKEETKTARQLGIQNKISRMDFVSLKGNKITKISSYDPKKYVYVEVLNSWKKTITRLLLSKTDSYELTGGVTEANRTITFGRKTPTGGNFVTAVRGVLRRLSEQLVEVIKTIKFAAVGARKLFDDDDDDSAPLPTQSLNLALAQVDSAGVDSAVVSKFASMGARVLDL
jgi:predicted DNA-binding WGR domain protein